MEQISLRAAPKPLLTSTANESPARRYSHGISRSYVACIRQFSSLSTRRRESWKSTQMSFVTKNSTTFWKTCRHAWQMSLKQHQWLGVKSVNVHHVLAKMLHFGWHEIIISNPKSEPSEYKSGCTIAMKFWKFQMVVNLVKKSRQIERNSALLSRGFFSLLVQIRSSV